MNRVLVATATFNEASNIAEWCERTRSALPTADMLIVDDSSPDGTADVVRGLMETDPQVQLMSRPAKSGLGSAHRAAMLYALENGYDALVTLDADLSHQPEDLPRLLAALEGADFVIGTRSGEGSSDYTGIRRVLSVAGNQAARLMIPTGLSEYTTSMRVFSPGALEILFTHGIRDEGYAFFMETVDILHCEGCRLVEVPIHFMDRARGQSKIPKHQIWLSATTLIRLAAKRARSSPQVSGNPGR